MVPQTINGDAHMMMMFEANKKSVGVAYVLWFFLGMLGAHRFYTARIGTAVVILALFIGGLLAAAVGGLLLIGVAAIWVLVDAFLIPGWIRALNMDLVSKLTAQPVVRDVY